MSGSASLKIVFGMTLVLTCSYLQGICQELSECQESYFPYHGVCLPCPDQCETCTSYTNCTRCNDNLYGPTCQHVCRPECESLCDKEYGNCTSRCPDGRFYKPKFKRPCRRCPANCKLCTSRSNCLECRTGFYGDTCMIGCLSPACRQCDQSTGICIACKDTYFIDEGRCNRCLDRCATCMSGTECTKCTGNTYGPTCQRTCSQECDGSCHLKYGYCTHGCPDGQYKEEGITNCSICPINCTLCISSAECVLCRPGYHGNTCAVMCNDHCVNCDQMNGSCLVCQEGYFNQDGRCQECPEGCAGCSDIMNCSGCVEGYSRIHDGHCIRECSQRVQGTHLIAIDKKEYGSKNTQSITDVCSNIENDQEFVLKTGTPCLKYMPCPSNDSCPSKDNHPGACAALLTYECTYLCQPLNESFHQCEKECNTNTLSTHNLTSCLSSSGPVPLDNVSTSSECLQDLTNATKEVADQTLLVSIVIGVSVVAALCSVIILCCRRRRRFMYKPSRTQTLEKSELQFGIEESIGSGSSQMINSIKSTPTSDEMSEEHTFIDNHEPKDEHSYKEDTGESTVTCTQSVLNGINSPETRLSEPLMSQSEPKGVCEYLDETKTLIEMSQTTGTIPIEHPSIDNHCPITYLTSDRGTEESTDTCTLVVSDGIDSSDTRLQEPLTTHSETKSRCGDLDETEKSIEPTPEHADSLNSDTLNTGPVTEATEDATSIHEEESVVEPTDTIKNEMRTESGTVSICGSA